MGGYSAAIMVAAGPSRLLLAARSVVRTVSGWVRRQLITGNRRVAAILTVVTAVISVAAVQVSESWFSPGLLILPVLAAGLLLWPRALRILFVLIAGGLAYDVVEGRAGPGLIATIAVTAVVADALARTREKLGMLGLRGETMLIELRDRIRAQGTLPSLPEGWGSVSVLRPAGGAFRTGQRHVAPHHGAGHRAGGGGRPAPGSRAGHAAARRRPHALHRWTGGNPGPGHRLRHRPAAR